MNIYRYITLLFFVPDPIPIVARYLTVVGLLLVALGVYWALKKKKKKTSSPQGTQCGSLGQLLSTHFIYEQYCSLFIDLFC